MYVCRVMDCIALMYNRYALLSSCCGHRGLASDLEVSFSYAMLNSMFLHVVSAACRALVNLAALSPPVRHLTDP